MTTYPDPTFSSIPNREVWSESPFGAPGAEAAKRLAEEATKKAEATKDQPPAPEPPK